MWNDVLQKCDMVPASYTRGMIDYYNEYYNTHDYSEVLFECVDPIGVFPGLVGRKIYAPIFKWDVSEKVQKKHCEQIYEMFKDNDLKYVFYDTDGISVFHRMLKEKGYQTKVKYEMFVNLLMFKNSDIRKSYRSLINQYKDKFKIEVFEECDDKLISDFRDFHIKTAGKETRSIATWKAQQKAVNNKEAFIIKIEDIAYSLFNYSICECLYSTAVYNRELTDQGIPLGHLTIKKALEHLQKIEYNVNHLKLGEYQFDGTPKEKAISVFKSGFANEWFPKYVLSKDKVINEE